MSKAIVLLLTFAGLMISELSMAEEKYADGGSDTCLACHEGMHKSGITALKQSPHGVLFYEGRGKDKACESCHGPSAQHADQPKSFAPAIKMTAKTDNPVEVNGACLSCHKDAELIHWHSGKHADAELNCLSCHSIHQSADKHVKQLSGNAMCIDCHTRQRAAMRMPSRHPINEGVTNCVDCHNPHGSLAEAQLKQPTLNDNCYQCHAEKRGPLLFEHAPVTEDCSTCHQAHGSVHKALLKSRPPFLCQQCHMAAGHVSVAQSGGNLSGNSSMLGKNCMNCHSQVHGSNHPSGARLSR